MKLNKILSIVLVLVTFMLLGTVSFAVDGTKYIDKIEATIEVVRGKAGTITRRASIKTEGVTLDKAYFPGDTITGNRTPVPADMIAIYMTLDEGYELKEGATGTLNGKKAKITQSAGKVIMTYKEPKKIDTVEVLVTEPVAGKYIDKNATLKTEGVEIVLVGWLTPDTVGELILKDTSKYEDGKKYIVRIFAKPKEGYEWDNEVTLIINGKEAIKMWEMPDDEICGDLEFSLEIEEKVIDTVEGLIIEPEVGKLIDNAIYVETEGLDYADFVWLDSEGGVITNSTERYEEGESYLGRFYARLEPGYKWANKVKFIINDREVVGVASSKAGEMYGEVEITLGTPKKAIDTVAISYKAPVAGEANSTKITTTTEGIEKATMSWVNKTSGVFMVKNEEYKVGSTYEARIFVYQEEGYKWADKVTFKINGKNVEGTTTATSAQTTMTYKLEEEKSEEIPEEKPEETPEETVKYPWTKISGWAEEELIEADEKGLIPASLENKDYTKNITRAEFAAAAVKLYEKLTKTKAVAIANNPFTDTSDKEILKAFNLGITNGMSATTFAPNAEITREQMATMMTRALTKAGINTKKPASVAPFADDSVISSWASDSVYYMSSIEIIKGVGANKFNPQGTATRDQALAVSIRSFKKLGK